MWIIFKTQEFIIILLYDSLNEIKGKQIKQLIRTILLYFFLFQFFKYQISKMKTSTSINIMNEYIVYKNQSLGKGATGEVYLGKSLKDKTQVAVKVIDIKTIDNEVTEYLLNMEKIALMTVINSHVLRGIKVIQNNQFCFLITELCNGGTLKAHIKMTGPLGQEKSLKYLIQILKGQCSLIGKGIVHRDLKPANILLHNGQVKIIDFGYCEIKGHQKPSLQYNVGSPSYMSPEAFLHNEYSEKSQIWAIGVTFYQCLNGKTFDQGKDMGEVYKQMKRSGLKYRAEVSQQCKNIIKWCLQHDPKKRPTCVQLLNYVVSNQNPKMTSSNSMRLSFTPLDNFQIKSKRQSLKGKIDLITLESSRKQQILKMPTSQNKVRPAMSSYEPKKYLLEKRPPLQTKPSVYYTKLKTEKNPLFTQLRPPIRQKSQLFQPQNNPLMYLSSRKRSRQHIFGLNPARTKVFSKPVVTHHRIGSINTDYFGHTTDRI